MASPILYSANPWLASEVCDKYRGGKHFAWVCEYFDSERALAGTAGTLIAPSSNPRRIYEQLLHEFRAQEEHPRVIKDLKKTFTRLANNWHSAGEITKDECAEIIASVRARSWRIWMPVIYVIPRHGIDPGRIKEVRRSARAGYGPEFQIDDLVRDEFDIVDLSVLVRATS
jgi:hypothetical protein